MDDPHHRAPARAVRRVAAGGALVVLALLALAGPAGAHATLVSVDPADGSTVDLAPAQVTLVFNESVSIGAGGVEVLDGDGRPVQREDATVQGGTVTVPLPADLPEGTYVVSYRLTSADGHPIAGASVFGLGVAPDADRAASLAPDSGPWGLVAGAGRALSYAGALGAGGAAVFLAFVAAPGIPRRSFRWVVPVAAGLAVASVPVLVVAQAARVSGAGLGAVGDSQALGDALGQGLGVQALLVAVGAAAAVLSTRVPLPSARLLSATSVAVTAAGLAQWGHPRAADPAWAALVADTVHVAAAAVWFGGLVLLAWVLVARLGTLPEATATVTRFSTLAGGAAAAVVAAGLLLAWVEVGGLGDALATTYARLTMAKAGLVVLVLALGGLNRARLVPALLADGATPAATTAPDPDPEAVRAWALLRRTVAAEVALLVVVLGVTTVLVEVTPPAGGSDVAVAPAATPVPFHGEAPIGDGATLVLDIVPAAVGSNGFHLSYVGPSGTLVQLTESVTLEMALPSAGLGPIEREAVLLTEGHYTYEGTDLSIAGEWTVTVVSRLSRFEEQRDSFQVPIS